MRSSRTRIATNTCLLCAMATTACEAQSRTAQTLSRPAALAILKQNSGRLLGQGPMARLPMWVQQSNMQASEADIQGGPLDYSGLPRGQFLQLKYLNRLEQAGLIKREWVKNINVVGQKSMAVYYRPVPHSDMSVQAYGSGPINSDAFTITAGRLSFGEVTGIQQDGNKAAVEVLVISSLTPLFRQMFDICDKLLVEEKAQEQFRDIGLGSLQDAYNAMSRKQTRSFTFSRYDDGWRIDP